MEFKNITKEPIFTEVIQELYKIELLFKQKEFDLARQFLTILRQKINSFLASDDKQYFFPHLSNLIQQNDYIPFIHYLEFVLAKKASFERNKNLDLCAYIINWLLSFTHLLNLMNIVYKSIPNEFKPSLSTFTEPATLDPSFILYRTILKTIRHLKNVENSPYILCAIIFKSDWNPYRKNIQFNQLVTPPKTNFFQLGNTEKEENQTTYEIFLKYYLQLQRELTPTNEKQSSYVLR